MKNMKVRTKLNLILVLVILLVALGSVVAFGGKDVQKKLLEADGIEVVNGTVDLKKYGLTQRDDKL